MADEDETLAGRAANGEGEEPETQLFEMGSVEGDEGVNWKTLIKAGLPVELPVSMKCAEVPSRGKTLLHPEREHKLLVSVEAGEVHEVPVREGTRGSGKRKLTGWKLRQDLAVLHVERLAGDADTIEGDFAVLVDGNPRAAAEVLERLQRRMAEALQVA